MFAVRASNTLEHVSWRMNDVIIRGSESGQMMGARRGRRYHTQHSGWELVTKGGFTSTHHGLSQSSHPSTANAQQIHGENAIPKTSAQPTPTIPTGQAVTTSRKSFFCWGRSPVNVSSLQRSMSRPTGRPTRAAGMAVTQKSPPYHQRVQLIIHTSPCKVRHCMQYSINLTRRAVYVCIYV